MAGRLPADYAQDGLELDLELADGAHDDEARIPLVSSRSSGQATASKDRVRETRMESDDDDKGDSEGEEEADAEWAELTELEAELAKEHHGEASQHYPPRRRESEKHKDQDAEDPALAMVRAVVKETDDPSLPNITFRVLLLGSLLCTLGAAISQLFFVSAKNPSD